MKVEAVAGDTRFARRLTHTWHHPDKQLFEMTKFGPGAMVPGYQNDMPGFEDTLSDADI